MFQLISIIEVTMRNAFHRALSRYCTKAFPTGHRGAQVSNNWYELLDLTSKSRENVRGLTHVRLKNGIWVPKRQPPSSDDVVSRLTYGFWQHLLDTQMDINGAPVPWPDLLTEIASGHRHNSVAHWNRQRHRDALFARIDLIKDFRNRIAHLEPVWKHGDLMEEKRPRKNVIIGVEFPRPTNPSDALARIKLIHSRGEELLKWFSVHRHDDYLQSYARSQLEWLLSQIGFDAYRRLGCGSTQSLERFCHDIREHADHGRIVHIEQNGKRLGTFFPV